MAKPNRILLILFILVAIKCGVAQIIFDDKEIFTEPTEYMDQKVKNLLLSKFASIDYEIGRTLNDMKKPITIDLESKLLLNVNNRISKMEDEIRIMKEKCSLKENSEQELITNITDTLDSKIKSSLNEMGLYNNVSYNSLEEKISKLTKNINIKLDRLEPKVADLEKNVSILHSEFEDNLNTSQEIFQMITNKSDHVLEESFAFAVNHSARMKLQLETYFNENLSSSLTNITNLIQITNGRLDLESFNNSVTMSSFEQKMRDLQTEEKEMIANTTETLDSKIHAKFLETTLAMNKSLVLVDKKMSSLAESMEVKIDRSVSKIAEIGQNVSISQSKSQEEFNNSLTSVRMEIITKEESLQRSVSMAVKNSLQMIQELETYCNEKLSSFFNNLTKLIQITNDRLDHESFNNSVTMSSFEQKMRDLQTKEKEMIANTTKTLDSKIHAKFLETTIAMNKSLVLVDKKMSSLAESMRVKIDRSVSKIAEIGQNVSISQSKSKEEFNNSLTSVRMEIITKEESLQRSVSMAVKNSLQMIQELETYCNEKLSSFFNNITKLIQITNDRLDLESFNNSVTMSSFEQKMQDLQTEEKEMIANTTETLDSKIHAKFLETTLAMNKSLVLVDKKMSSLAESMRVKIDRSVSKIAEIGQNVSISQSKSKEEFNNSLTSVRMEIITKEESLQRSVSMAVKNSLQMIQELETYCNEKLSSFFNNITKLIQITNDRLDLESFNNSVTMSSFEQKMQDLQTEEKEMIANTTETLDSKIHAKFLETTLAMNKSLVLVDKKMSSLAESMRVKIDRSVSKIAEIGQNVSISQSKSQEEFNNSLTSVRMEITTKEESLQRSVSMAVNNSLRMIKQLETYFNDQFSSYMKNFTKMIQFTDKRVELESYNNNSTMFSLEEKMNTLQKEKVNLEDELMKAKTNLSVLNRQAIVKWQAIQYQLNENYQQVFTLINETRKDQEKMVHEFAKNLSDVLALQRDVFQNVSVISAEVKNLELKTILDIENQGMETNKTAEQVLRFEFNLNSCNSRIETLEKYQNVLSVQNNITIEQMELIEGNMSTWNRQLQTTIDLHNDAKALKNITILELSRVMLNISNILNTIRGFETYHANQNSRLGTIERRQTNISSSLSDIKTTLNYAGIIRLSNGGRYYGRIEVYYNGAWGTVCDDSWDSNDAYVACRMLGLSGGTAKSSAFYGQGSGSIWLDDLQCSGSESSLFACIHLPVGSHNCGHNEDAGVICS